MKMNIRACVCGALSMGAAAYGGGVFEIDPALSELSIVDGRITIQGAVTFDALEAEPGSWTAPLAGTLEVETDAGELRVLGSSMVSAVDGTLFVPGAPGAPETPAPGSYKVLYPTAPALGFDFTSVTRNLTFSVDDGDSTMLDPSGTFAVMDQTWTVTSGVADLSAGNPPQSDLTTVAPVANDPATLGSLTSEGGVETLTIPVSLTLVISGGITNILLEFEGEVVATRSTTPACPADLSGDGTVGAEDLAALVTAWGVNPGSAADLDGDGSVGASDLAAMIGAWGPCP